jgi:protein-S-isoprenylcysteine O-methyltransferase Ste14
MIAWTQLRVILLMPGVVAVVIPATILVLTGVDTFSLWQSHPATQIVLPTLGILFVAVGVVLMVATIRLFVKFGNGTIAPWNPTQRLVVQGIYRHVRNPMISGGMLILLGEALLAASLPLFLWFVFAVALNAVYIPLSEEPGLAKRFGEEYLTYKRNVPRWIPMLRGWKG